MDRRLGKNLIMSIGFNLLTVIVPFITAPYLGRVLGAENVGSYTYVHSICWDSGITETEQLPESETITKSEVKHFHKFSHFSFLPVEYLVLLMFSTLSYFAESIS